MAHAASAAMPTAAKREFGGTARLPNDFAVELPAPGQQHFWSMNVRSDPPSAQTSDFL